MYQFYTNIPQQEYDAFVVDHPKSNFNQSYAYGQLKIKSGFKPHYVGLKKDNELVATALILEKTLYSVIKYFYIPRGMTLDYSNLELLDKFIEELNKYAKYNKVCFLKIDPDLKLQAIDDNAQPLAEQTNTNFPLVAHLESLGFKHSGYVKNFENNMPRYTFRLNLLPDLKDIKKNFHQTIRNIVNRQTSIVVEKGTIEDIKYFNELMHSTAKRQAFTSSGDTYYEDFYKTLSEYGICDIYCARLDVNALVAATKVKIEQLTSEILVAKNENKRNELLVQQAKQTKELAKFEAVAKDYDHLVLSAMITVKYGKHAWTVHGGNHDLLRELNANYYIYYHIIEDMKKAGCEWIDFFGTTGDPDPANPIYGIYLFKKRLGGEYCEFIGEFDYVYQPFKYDIYQKYAPKLRSLLKR